MDYNGSDHEYIYFELEANNTTPRIMNNKTRGSRKWRVEKLNERALIDALDANMVNNQHSSNNDHARTKVKHTMEIINQACDAAMPRHKNMRKKKSSLLVDR